MRIRAAVLVSVVLLLCPIGWTQTKSLGDVAGSIKLNPEALVEKNEIVVDPRDAKKADGELFGSVLVDCSAVAGQIGELVTQARTTTIYRGDSLLTRLEESTRELERELQGIFVLRLGEGFAEPYLKALDAADSCEAACAVLLDELGRNAVTFTKANTEMARCREQLSGAQEALAVVMNQPGASAGIRSQPNETETAMTDDEIVAARCREEKPKGTGAVDTCQKQQYLSLAAMASRNAGNELLEAGVFADIRRLCLEIYPLDFVRRDNCELKRMTESRLDDE